MAVVSTAISCKVVLHPNNCLCYNYLLYWSTASIRVQPQGVLKLRVHLLSRSRDVTWLYIFAVYIKTT